ncbi:MAG: alpha-D-ribose 1-methylphosphonate 5-triphosphate diphosphatase [Pseudomonadota bacterium]
MGLDSAMAGDICRIEGGRVLTPGGLVSEPLAIAAGKIVAEADGAPVLDAAGLLVLPGIVDVHGDAFERQIMPRPTVTFPMELALLETDRQLVANGITTAYHGVTISWEPGLRSAEMAESFARTLARLRPQLAADTRLHLRWETFALEAADLVVEMLGREAGAILAFNDHTTSTMAKGQPDAKLGPHADRAGLDLQSYRALMNAVWAHRDAVPSAIERMARRAREAGATLLAHDERSPETRAYYRGLGARASEFPLTRETAEAARAAGEHTVMGAPNVVRGGSHMGMMGAAEAVRAGLCTVLASDYYYPALLHGVFRLVREGMALEDAWPLVSGNAAEVAGLTDRGRLAPGLRADLILVDDSDPALPRVRAALVAGRQVFAG